MHPPVPRSPLKGGELWEHVRGPTIYFRREHVGNTWEHVRFVRDSREHVGNRSSQFRPIYVGNTSGIGRIYFMY